MKYFGEIWNKFWQNFVQFIEKRLQKISKNYTNFHKKLQNIIRGKCEDNFKKNPRIWNICNFGKLKWSSRKNWKKFSFFPFFPQFFKRALWIKPIILLSSHHLGIVSICPNIVRSATKTVQSNIKNVIFNKFYGPIQPSWISKTFFSIYFLAPWCLNDDVFFCNVIFFMTALKLKVDNYVKIFHFPAVAFLFQCSPHFLYPPL